MLLTQTNAHAQLKKDRNVAAQLATAPVLGCHCGSTSVLYSQRMDSKRLENG